MKKTILLTSIIAIAIVSMLSSCVDSEKDLYDPSYQTANPMGDGFAAPDGFDWATTSNIKVTVEVNAPTNDEFYYVVELYDTNPIISSDARLLDKGVAKGNEPYTSEISIENTIKQNTIDRNIENFGEPLAAAVMPDAFTRCLFLCVDLRRARRASGAGVCR